MSGFPRLALAPLAMAVAVAVSGNVVATEQVRYHRDHRDTAKLVLVSPEHGPAAKQQKAAAVSEVTARSYLKNQAKRFGVPADLNGLTLSKTRESLTAVHYHYQQYVGDVPVLRGEVIVSLNKQNGAVMRAFNNFYPTSSLSKKNATAKLDQQQALSKAWTYLQGAGELIKAPAADLFYADVNGALKLAYRTQLRAEQPFGAWEHLIDAETGDVLQARRVDLPNKRAANPAEFGHRWPAATANPAHQPFAKVQQKWLAKQSAQKSAQVMATPADGSARVLDPDPRTTLNDSTLQDNSAIPLGAYFTETLRDIDFTGANYRLVGPWVQIVNIGAPNTAPSVTADGVWDDLRGNNAFNDANTYYHLDKNQRYIQALGFNTPATGKAIQYNSIEADSDGADGEDQSFFNPNGNYLEFGHGCVDDNEDADVILHEYGHALQWDINNNWDGGDTGGMGEGFGDYWAGSYSYSTPNGATFNPALVFTWDGPGCWAGRRMDRTTVQYNPAETYGAHEVVNGVLADELWSTPLFQSLITLVGLGVDREEVDQIVLEAHFGLGANVTMPEMALSTVQAACTLYPNGQHAAVFADKFAQVNILPDGNGTAPVAQVERSAISATVSTTVTLNASDSFDPSCDDITFSWQQTAGTAVTLSNAAVAQPTFTAPAANGTLTFRVTVSDGTNTDTQDVTVTVTGATSGGGGGGGGGGGSFAWFSLLPLLALAWRRVRR